jgi:hypothetical protein
MFHANLVQLYTKSGSRRVEISTGTLFSSLIEIVIYNMIDRIKYGKFGYIHVVPGGALAFAEGHRAS